MQRIAKTSTETVYIFHSHLLYSTGGTRFIFEVASRLVKKKHVVIIVERLSDEWRKKLASSGVTILELGGLTSNSLLYWLFFPFIFCINYLKLSAELTKTSGKILSFLFPMNVMASLFSLPHVQYCFEPFAFFYDKALQKSLPFPKNIFLRGLSLALSPFDKHAVKTADRLLAINPSVGTSIKSIYRRSPDNYSYLGVDTDHFKEVRVKPTDQVTIFHSTDYTPLKGTHFLVDALCLLDPKYADTIKVFISESLTNNTAKNSLKQKLKDHDREKNVVFLSHVSYQELPRYYSMSDAFYFLGDPSSMGATAASLSVLEAQSCGTPVIRSIGNTDEIIEDQTGFYVDPRNALDLVKYLELQVTHPEIFKDMRKHTRKHILKNYTWDKVVARIEDEIALV